MLAVTACAGASAPATPDNALPNVPPGSAYHDSLVLTRASGLAMRAFFTQLPVGERHDLTGFTARVDCEITLDGHITDCRPVRPVDEPLFETAFISALQQPDMQGPSMLLDGKAVVGRHVFAINLEAHRTRR